MSLLVGVFPSAAVLGLWLGQLPGFLGALLAAGHIVLFGIQIDFLFGWFLALALWVYHGLSHMHVC